MNYSIYFTPPAIEAAEGKSTRQLSARVGRERSGCKHHKQTKKGRKN